VDEQKAKSNMLAEWTKAASACSHHGRDPHGDTCGTPSGSPETDKLIAASVQWAERMHKIDIVFPCR
jgi:hypothetical protein